MQEAFQLGGWGMYPTTFIGLVLIVAAIQYARQPERRRYAVVRSLNTLTLLSGILGVVVGTMKTCLYVPSDELHLVVVGFGESLNNIALALCMLSVARIITTIGVAREPSELVDPRG